IGRDNLLDLHADMLDGIRKPRQSVLHAIIRKHQREVYIATNLKRYGDVAIAITGRLASDVIHTFDAVDCLFQRSRDSPCDFVGSSAWISCRDLDGRRNDVRILSYRQRDHGCQPEQSDESVDDYRKTRTFNKKVS